MTVAARSMLPAGTSLLTLGDPGDPMTLVAETLLADYISGFYEPGQSMRPDDDRVLTQIRQPFAQRHDPPSDGAIRHGFVAVVEDEPAGLVLVRDRPAWGPEPDGSLEVTKVYVRLRHRGHGLGRMLVRAAVAAARGRDESRPVRLATVSTTAPLSDASPDLVASRVAARALYERLGFVLDEPHQHDLPRGLDRMTWRAWSSRDQA